MTNELYTAKKTTLPNGLIVVSEAMPQVRTAAVGVWVKSGSRVEPAEVNGISHFIEHMVFKGTARRSAEQIAQEADALGGHLDAFTAKELVCFNMKVLDQHLPEAFDILADLVTAPAFRDADIEKERAVITEEIKMEEDNPEYLVHELLSQNFWHGHAIGRPILGTVKTLGRFNHDVVTDFHQRWYAPNRMVVCGAGHLEHERLVELAAAKLGGLKAQSDGHRDSAPQARARLTTRSKKDLEQVHLCVGAPACPLPDERRYAVSLLANILGGGMSSRLFQRIREKEGLAYAVFADVQAYRDTGLMTVYAGTARETAQQALHLILMEMRRLKKEPVAVEELQRAKDNLKTSLMLSLESTTARMSNLARQEVYFGRFFNPDEILAAIDAVSAEQVQAAAQEFFQAGLLGATVLGHLDGLEFSRDALEC
ncbi:MAG TPA: pitrilysin family protein [Candidatus Xenobia bacterium]|nr:pitrilysin family protein [Candidatus Xenobia bacterium]